MRLAGEPTPAWRAKIALVTALGIAFTLFVALAAIQTSLSAEIARTVPARAPDQFVLDIPSIERDRFTALVEQAAPGAEVNVVPTLRGTITAFGGQRVADLETLPAGAWFLRGERGVTYSGALPPGSEIVAGSWWPADYRGPPILSLDREAAEVMGVGIGDTLTVSVLGREIEARIASLREIHWDTMGFNYILVFPPSVLEAAPHNLAATIAMEDDRQAAVSDALLGAFPGVSIVVVGELIARVGAILQQMSAAILLAASVVILAGIAVLIGALSASRQARTHDSIVMKTLGASRGQILAGTRTEYALLAFILASVSLALGLAGALWSSNLEFGWNPDGAGAGHAWWVDFLTLGIGWRIVPPVDQARAGAAQDLIIGLAERQPQRRAGTKILAFLEWIEPPYIWATSRTMAGPGPVPGLACRGASPVENGDRSLRDAAAVVLNLKLDAFGVLATVTNTRPLPY